ALKIAIEFDRVHSSKFIFSTHSAKVGIIILLGGLNAYTYFFKSIYRRKKPPPPRSISKSYAFMY
ncbi:MAG: hypothetical protein SNI51_09275, partial [Rikenellaceae bacterium]